ncbi:hypothetical protein HYR54_13140 [Candidatus Acetothermia bacterium]|nr:hypothetical protein [Candidatus Acetothermia bacterium]
MMRHSQQLWVGGVVVGVLAILLGLGLMGGFSSNTGVSAAQGGSVFAQLSSLKTQQPTTTGPTLMTFDQIDGLSGMGFNPAKPTDIVVQKEGAYLIIAAAQLGRSSGESDDYVDLWIRVNGKDVDNSNTRETIRNAAFTDVLVSQGAGPLKAGDVIQVAYSVSATGKGLGIIATTPKNEAAIPSIILTVAKLP